VIGRPPPQRPKFTLLKPLLMMRKRVTDNAMELAEKTLVTEAMLATGGQSRDAALLLGVSDRVMNYKLAKWRLRPSDGVDWPCAFAHTTNPLTKAWALRLVEADEAVSSHPSQPD
jgi:hypothetical protein